ncbi:MAG: hypothetical protein RIT25_1873 [Planctomycetota bacterium]
MKTTELRGKVALVWGLGRFGGGREAVRYLHAHGCRVRIADKSTGADLAESRAALASLQDLDWQLGREDAALLDGIDLLVVNPAIPDEHPLLAAARTRGVHITQEANLFLEAYPGRVVIVTGTNGKSTTSTLLAAALRRGGVDTLLGGNIGHSLLADEGRWRTDQVAVLEISSFQLDRVDVQRHRVTGAVITRVLKDHIDRHKTLAAYHGAKARAAVMATEFVVCAADDAVACGFAHTARLAVRCRPAAVPAEGETGLEDGWVTVRLAGRGTEQVVHTEALQLLGTFQRENVMAAATAALLLGAAPHGIGLALATARPLPFRLQQVAVLGGIRILDNGVSTEIESTRSALQSLQGRIHWVGGGKSKDGDYRAVADGVSPHLASAHLFGAAAQPLGAILADRIPTTVHVRLVEALEQAMAAARPGDLVLFSPAFASFDQYANFRARAMEFHQWLRERRAANGAQAPAAAQAATS